VSASLLAAMRAAGERVRVYKPVVTGVGELVADAYDEAWPADHELLASAAGMDAEDVAPLRYAAAAAPKLAAELAGERIDSAGLVARAPLAAVDPAGGDAEIAVVEGVGGLLVPFNEEFCVCDLAVALGLSLLIAARPGLGTINHTLLTLGAAGAAGLDVRAVVLTPWPPAPSELERSNREEIERLGDIEVAVLRRVRGPDLDELARAGRWLPWRRWLSESADRLPVGESLAPAVPAVPIVPAR
jgi:dethiobiotin synthetase